MNATTTPARAGNPCCNLDAAEVLAQVGRMTVLSVSGGRSIVEPDRLVLPCGYGYSVVVTLSVMDTYTVSRVFTRSGVESVKGQQEDVYCDELSEAVHAAGMFRMPWPAGGIN